MNIEKLLFELIKVLYKKGFMKTRFYKLFCYKTIIGEKICELICKQM